MCSTYPVFLSKWLVASNLQRTIVYDGVIPIAEKPRQPEQS